MSWSATTGWGVWASYVWLSPRMRIAIRPPPTAPACGRPRVRECLAAAADVRAIPPAAVPTASAPTRRRGKKVGPAWYRPPTDLPPTPTPVAHAPLRPYDG